MPNEGKDEQGAEGKAWLSKPLLTVNIKKLVNAGLLEYRVEYDEERMIIRKYYRTRKDLRICLDEKTLKKIAEKLDNEKV